MPPEALTDANTRLEFSNSGTAMVGNALAGALVQCLSAAAAIGFDALTYVASLVSLVLTRVKEPQPDGPR